MTTLEQFKTYDYNYLTIKELIEEFIEQENAKKLALDNFEMLVKRLYN